MAIVGGGFIADSYVETLRRYPQIEIVGAFDRDPARLARFCRSWELPAYRSLAALVGDARVDIVVNLTSARSHFEVSRAALEGGKHVYTEKPLAMDLPSATALVELAEAAAEGRTPRLSARHALHVAELTLAMQDASQPGATRALTTRFEPIAPMPWAE